MKEEEVEGDYRTLCSHTNACVNTHIQAHTGIHTRIYRRTVRAHKGTHTILAPGGQFYKQAYVGWFDSYLGFVTIGGYKV